jgi:uncharacterized protein
MSEPKYTNALAGETSPYLLQHAHNPVQWHPWSEEALAKAKEEDKPILLSIGYSACHWCHVMEHESFENEKIAAVMNKLFVCIKVDREERPDLDTIYMQAVQLITGRGGWPMTVFLTPDQAPFYGGSYYPPEDRQGMPGFVRVLQSVAKAYREKRDNIARDGATIIQQIRKEMDVPGVAEELSPQILDQAANSLMSNYDARYGGFGGAPKFPPSMSLDVLMRSYYRTENRRHLDAVEHTLQQMAFGGMYDQLGGGFHRYSVDAIWLVPHFEKMLYDNALLSRTYLHGFLLAGNPLYRRIVEETLDYVVREMTAPEGGFYSTQDADSEGEEGKYYTWNKSEIEERLGDEDARLFCRYYGATESGPLEGRNILHVPRHIALVAKLNNLPEQDLSARIEHGRRILFEAREKRIKPGRDEKILVSWNGLMIRSFAEAARGLEREDYSRAAQRCAGFILDRMCVSDRLLHSCKDGRARIEAFLDDYACLIDGLLSLYETTFDARWLREAARLAGVMVDQFLDRVGFGFFLTPDNRKLIHRPKDFYDNATPAGNSVASYALLRLAKLTGDESWTQPVLPILRSLASRMARHASAFGHLLGALDFALSDAPEIAVVGPPSEAETQGLLREVFRRYLPNKLVACGEDAEVFLLRGRIRISGRSTAYLCRNRVCNAPTTDPADLGRQLDSFMLWTRERLK